MGIAPALTAVGDTAKLRGLPSASITTWRWTPRRALTRVIGIASTVPIPRPLRRPVLGAIARRFGCDLGEAERPLQDYEDFQAFFTRALRPGARGVDEAPMVSPSDGEVTAQGPVRAGRMLQVKGIDYSVGELLGDEAEAEAFEGGDQITIYLHPRNYHRVHSPVDGSIVQSRHVPGSLFPVHSGASHVVPGLFAQNERLVTAIEGSDARVAVVMVAAMGCGHVRAAYDDDAWRRIGPSRYAPPKPVRRGDEIGTFAMGSTVVMLVAPGGCRLRRYETGTLLLQGAALAEGPHRNRAEESVG